MSLTLGEARTRASLIRDVSYEIDLDLTDATTGHASGTFGCTTTVRFTSSAADTFLELTAATDLAVTVNGRALPADAARSSYDGRRLLLTGLVEHNVVTVAARVPYVTDGDGMYLFTDPADGETYASAYCGMDVAQRVFACFDQNDLKATVALGVTADPTWTVVANGRVLEDGTDRDAGRWRFATTEVFAIPMFVVCAGPWHSRTWEHAGLPFGWHARRSLGAELDRDFEELRATTTACFDHYATLFTEPMPYDSYDQAFVPGQNWGALESPGCVTYRDELLPRGRVTDLARSQRASIIAHEMAHMWFGNLVTMTWWEDTWLQESFADYMGYRVSADGAGFAGALLQHELLRKPSAYQADERRSTHPVAPEAEDVPDVDAASNNFDAISYSKGNSVLRQLVTWLGDDAFLAGVNAYLGAHRLGNGTLADFMAALDSASDRDVLGWVHAWLRTSGFDTIRVTRDGGGVPVVSRDGTRPHRLRLTSYDEAPGGALVERESVLVDVGDEPVRLDDWAGRVVVPNSHGETFVRVVPDTASWSALLSGLSSIDDDLVRAIAWTTAFDLAHTRRLPAEDFLDLVSRHLPHERHVTAVAAVLTRTLDSVVPRRIASSGAAHAVDRVADACARGLDTTLDEQVRIELTRGLARTSRDTALLQGWLTDGVTDHGVALDPALRWRVVHRLAEVGALDADAIETERVADGTIDGELGAARALAARPTVEAKDAAWTALAEDDQVSNRRYEALTSGLWSPEQADLLAPYVAAYWQVSPRIAERRGQAFSQVVHRAFPALALTDDQVADLEQALAGDLPSVLRRGWEDKLDDLRPANT
ncbi:aminopeptidase [Nocardioides psychrotolerans]|uniref:Aminopeptidase N n=1 Tax=Nocardioides psychrotolerans TaxID=1005945 RepID=A0A1I3H4M9_9ACTN|nr:aminopeptidase N [Nocardioides psychrotolerans]GEP37751.1 aminopeptidase [Nocardioides psychrotolerans]SFI30641.1 aminopeptidase N [Nocardioides psychrotolerans]